jgi:hypothetical protein
LVLVAAACIAVGFGSDGTTRAGSVISGSVAATSREGASGAVDQPAAAAAAASRVAVDGDAELGLTVAERRQGLTAHSQ